LSAWLTIVFAVSVLCSPVVSRGQTTPSAKVEQGSRTAKNGFRNEDEIAAKFNNWKADAEARVWLTSMGYSLTNIQSVTTQKPHGEKSDVQVKIISRDGEFHEGVSIKLVSSDRGFNQIDKRWLSHYEKLWKMPVDVAAAMKLFVGETSPTRASKRDDRMFLTEMAEADRLRIVEFFTTNKAAIVSDLLAGSGSFTAKWFLVALKNGENPRWVLRRIDYVTEFFGDGPVEITRAGNLKIGRITMQRKGGDSGRETAKMLQFKINPALLFEGK
jgi:hypothetical protein